MKTFRSPALAAALLLLLPTACGRGKPAGIKAGAGKAAAAGRKILYYRNPMNPSLTSPVFRKDEMGMDYIPV
jgi:Cu(I)/Ag(I) efflux system membrane fusion protein